MTAPIIIYTDGACKGNPGPGGWAAILSYNGHRRELCGGEAHTTNNRMELTAVIRALQQLKKDNCQVQIYTDSKYVQLGMTEWLPTWRKKNYVRDKRKPVLNADLWRELDTIAARHQVEWKWVRAHNGEAGNEQADVLAQQQATYYQEQTA